MRRDRGARWQGAVKIAVLRHHVLPTPLVEAPEDGRPVSLTLDAGQFIEDLKSAVAMSYCTGTSTFPLWATHLGRFATGEAGARGGLFTSSEAAVAASTSRESGTT